MAVDKKIIERVEKLLRLAAPSSKSTEHERASAALEVARLFEEHNIALTDQEAPKNGRKAKSDVVYGAWCLTVAIDHCGCSHCHQKISPRDVVWVRVVNYEKQFRHNTDQCRVGNRG